jgi:hypothetical protein
MSGLARVISDGASICYLQDILVRPSHHRRGRNSRPAPVRQPGQARRRKALRQLRRDQADDGFMGFMLKRDLRRDTSLDRRPSRAVWYAVINDVTGNQWAGELEPEEAAELFVELMDRLQLVPKQRQGSRSFAALRRGSYTPPSDWKQGIIVKPSKRRR